MACLGETHAAAHFLEQLQTQFLFQLANLEGDRGLRAAEAARGFLEAALVHHGVEGLQTAQIHARLLFIEFIEE